MVQDGDVVGEPAAGGGGGEHDHDDGQQPCAHLAEALLEGFQSQRTAVGAVSPHAAQDDGQSRDGADDEGVEEDLKRTPQALADRVIGARGGVDHGRSTPAGLVGVDGAGHAHADDLGNGHACKAAHGSRAGEGIVEDGDEGSGHAVDVDHDHDDAHEDVDDAHDGHQLGEDLGHALDAAAGDDVVDNGQADAHQNDALHLKGADVDAAQMERTRHDLRSGQGGRSDKEGAEDADAEDDGRDQPQLAPMALLAKAVLHVIGRAAEGGGAVLLGVAVVAAQRDFHLLQDHAQSSGEPHPEHSARAAGCHSGGHTGNVAEADGAADGGGNGLERVQHTFAGLVLIRRAVEDLAHGVFHDPAKVGELEKSGPHSKVDAGGQHQDDKRDAPEDAIQPVQEVDHCFLFPLSFSAE